MPVTAASLLVKVTAGTSSAESALGRVTTLFRNVGVVAVTATAAAAVASLKMAGDFQASTLTLVTGAGESVKNIGQLRDGILDLATQTATPVNQLTDGMFMVSSAASNLGQQGNTVAKRLLILRDAAEAARESNASLATTTDAVTTVMSDFSAQNVTAAQASNLLLGVVSLGKTRLEDLAGSVSQVLPAASALHINLDDVAGAMATMTAEGVPAANAATYLRQTLVSLSAPAKAGQKALADIGLTTAEVSSDMKKSLPDTLNLIMTHLAETYQVGSPQYVQALKNIAGGSKQMQGLLDLTGSHLQTFGNDVKAIADKVKQGGNTIAGWNLVQKTFNFQMDRAREVVETLAIRLGSRLLPIATQLASWIADNLTPAFNSLMNIIAPVSDVTGKVADKLGGLADACKALMVPFDEGSRAVGKLNTVIHPLRDAFDESASAAKRIVDATKPVVPIFDEGSRAVARLGTSTKTAHSPIQVIGDVLKAVAGFVKTDVIPTVQQLATFFVTDMVPALAKVTQDFQKDVLPTLGNVVNFVRADVLPVVEKLALWFVTKVVPAAMQVVKWFGDDILPVLRQVWQVVATQVIPVVQGIAENVMANLVPAIEHLISKIAPVLIPILHAVADTMKNEVGPALNFVIGFISGLINVITTVISKVEDFFNLLGSIKDKVGGFVNNLKNIPVVGGAIGTVTNLLPHFAQGGVMAGAGLAVVGEQGPELVQMPGGARITPLARGQGISGLPAGLSSSLGGIPAGGITIPVTLKMGTRIVAQEVIKLTPEIIRNATGKRSF